MRPAEVMLDEGAAAGGEELLGDQHGEGCADGVADDADVAAGERQDIELGVVAGPARVPGGTVGAGVVNQVAIRVEHAQGGHVVLGQASLATGFLQQVGGLEDGRGPMVLGNVQTASRRFFPQYRRGVAGGQPWPLITFP